MALYKTSTTAIPSRTVEHSRETVGVAAEMHLCGTRLQSPRGWWRRITQSESFYAASCCAIVLLCVLVANPFANAGFDDDWSYSHVALRFAETGTVHYNGWGSPTLLFQTIWGAALIRLFGFSFDILRGVTLPFSLGFVWLVYTLGRAIGLRRDLACFGALALGTSPLFLPLAASFMTEPYACFFTTLCIYAAIRGAQTPHSAKRWLWVLAISGILGGSDRQTVWVAPLILIPYLFWIRRPERSFSIHCVASFVFCLASLATIAIHFKPPYAVFAITGPQLHEALAQQSVPALGRFVSLCLSCLMFTMPCLLCFTRFWRRLDGLELCMLALGSAALVAALIHFIGPSAAAPFIGGLLSSNGILHRGEDLLGYRPILLATPLRIILSVLIVFSGVAFVFVKAAFDKEEGIYRSFFWLFTSAYTVLLLPGLLLNISFDRYALPVLPLAIILILDRFRSAKTQNIPFAAWLCLLVFAGYGIVVTHDYASDLRARTDAARTIQRRGVPRDRISAGLEYDGWTQLLQTGHIKGVDYETRVAWNYSDHFWFWSFATALRPDYVVTYARTPDPEAASTLGYTSWTPPFQRFVEVRKRALLPKGPVCVTPGVCSLPD